MRGNSQRGQVRAPSSDSAPRPTQSRKRLIGSNFRLYGNGTRGTVLSVNVRSFHALKRAEDRERMADLRRARRNRRAAVAFERRYALTYGSKGRITNLREMMQAMAQ